ncbi:MAG: 2-amino-4-hydroxy-6-hydroxymethyldihydropteridine diphosphokinase, partial [Acidimicrobiia bacterium]
MRAFVGLGSNLGERQQHLRDAVEALRSHGIDVREVSSVYETDPVGPAQPDFLNAACEIATDLSPRNLLSVLKAIEQELGRAASERWG